MRILTLFIQHRAYQFVEFVLKFSGNASSAAARHSAGTLSKVLRSKMGDFLYSLDKFRLDKKSVSKMLDDTRTGMLTQVGHEEKHALTIASGVYVAGPVSCNSSHTPYVL